MDFLLSHGPVVWLHFFSTSRSQGKRSLGGGVARERVSGMNGLSLYNSAAEKAGNLKVRQRE